MELTTWNLSRSNIEIFFNGTAKCDKSIGTVSYNQIHFLMDNISNQCTSTIRGPGEIATIVLTDLIHSLVKSIIRAEPHIVSALGPGVGTGSTRDVRSSELTLTVDIIQYFTVPINRCCTEPVVAIAKNFAITFGQSQVMSGKIATIDTSIARFS